MFNHDALNLIQTTAVGAASARPFLPPPGTEPPNVYWVHRNGDPERVVGKAVTPAVAGDLNTIARYAEDAFEFPAIWYDRTGVRVVADEAVQAVLPLTPSPLLLLLAAWDKAGGYATDQAGAYKLFRTTLRDAFGTSLASILAAVKEVSVRVESTATGVVDRQKTSMGKSVVAESNGNPLPDLLTLTVPVFAGSVEVSAAVRLTFDLNPATGQFVLTVLPGEVERAFAWAERVLGEDLRRLDAMKADTAPPVYFGRPG